MCNDHNGFKVTRDETYPVEQSSIENILPSIWCFIQPPSYEKAPKLMDQGTRNSKSYKEYSNSKLLPSIPQVTINHVLLEPLMFSHFPVMDLIGQPLEPHSIHRVPHQKKPNWHITMQSRCHRVQRIMNEILLNFKTLTSLSRHWPLGLPKSSYGTFATKWMRCFRKLLWRIFSNKYCSECSVR